MTSDTRQKFENWQTKMSRLLQICVAALAFALSPVSGANATEVLFTITSFEPSIPTTTFELPLNPTPDYYSLGIPGEAAGDFSIYNILAISGGSPIELGAVFYSAENGGVGGLIIGIAPYYLLYFNQLYYGPENSPTFDLGVFPESNGTVTITAIPDPILDPSTITAVPEPSTWAMMLIGFGGLGLAAAYRSRRKVADAAV
jgi:hypothetical protein